MTRRRDPSATDGKRDVCLSVELGVRPRSQRKGDLVGDPSKFSIGILRSVFRGSRTNRELRVELESTRRSRGKEGRGRRRGFPLVGQRGDEAKTAGATARASSERRTASNERARHDDLQPSRNQKHVLETSQGGEGTGRRIGAPPRQRRGPEQASGQLDEGASVRQHAADDGGTRPCLSSRGTGGGCGGRQRRPWRRRPYPKVGPPWPEEGSATPRRGAKRHPPCGTCPNRASRRFRLLGS